MFISQVTIEDLKKIQLKHPYHYCSANMTNNVEGPEKKKEESQNPISVV